MSPLSLAPLIHNPDRQMVYDTSDKTECTYINDLKSMEDKVLQELEGQKRVVISKMLHALARWISHQGYVLHSCREEGKKMMGLPVLRMAAFHCRELLVLTSIRRN